jgi:hypothetical protein
MKLRKIHVKSKGRYKLSVKLSDVTVTSYQTKNMSKLRSFDGQFAQASQLSFPFVLHTQNCADYSGNPTVSSVYLPTPRWHHLKAIIFNISF